MNLMLYFRLCGLNLEKNNYVPGSKDLQWAVGLCKTLQIFVSIQRHVEDSFSMISLYGSFFKYLVFL